LGIGKEGGGPAEVKGKKEGALIADKLKASDRRILQRDWWRKKARLDLRAMQEPLGGEDHREKRRQGMGIGCTGGPS